MQRLISILMISLLTYFICQLCPINRVLLGLLFARKKFGQKQEIASRLTKLKHTIHNDVSKLLCLPTAPNGLVNRYIVDAYFVIPSSSFSGRPHEGRSPWISSRLNPTFVQISRSRARVSNARHSIRATSTCVR